jgi:hypothetical protein
MARRNSCRAVRRVAFDVMACELMSAICAADVPLPEGIIPPTEENDELRAEADADTSKPEKWTETGLHTVQ